MDDYDDIQIEEFSHFDFVEEMNEGLFDEDEDDKTFNSFLNSNNDNWLWLPIHLTFMAMPLLSWDW